MNKRNQNSRLRFPAGCLLLGIIFLGGGCRAGDKGLRLSDLTPGETLYCQRIITLERAKVIAWTNRERGDTVLDSLALAWGDSVAPETMAGISANPTRSADLGRLLLRLVSAEQDSMAANPTHSRLGLPLPDPDRKAPGPAAWSPASADPDSADS